METALRESEARYRGIFEAVDDVIYTIESDGTFSSLSPSFERITGWLPDEWIGKHFTPLAHPDDLPRMHELFGRLLSGETLPPAEMRLMTKAGTYLDAELKPAAIRRGDSITVFGVLRDITERKRMDKLMRRQLELNTQIIETVPMRVFWKDLALRYVGCNTVFARDAGYDSPGDLIGKDDFQMGWREQAEIYRADDRRVMDANELKLSYNEPQTTPAGERIWLRTSKVPLHNEVNEVIGLLGTYEDITERRNVEIALRESEARYRGIFDAVDDLIYTLEADGTFSSLSPSFERMTGWLPEEWIGKHFRPLTHPDDLPRVQELFGRLLSGEALPPFDLRLITKAGTYLDTEIKPVTIPHGDSITISGVLRDITERKRVEEKIRQLNEELEIKVHERTGQLLEAQDELVRKEKLSMLGQVAGTVGHELRNPLGVISNAVYFLQTVLSDSDETTREYLGIIKNEVTAADRIVGDLLDSVRIKPPQPETVGIAQLIEQTMGKCTIPTSVTVKLDTPESLPPLWVDSMQIRQVLRNLVNNGVEAMPAGGTLKIRAAAGAGAKNVTVRVTDSGIGMTPEQLGKLFQPLLTTKARGIGLGLMVVKNLTEANGGRVAVESAPGAGSTFAVTLPAGGTEMQREGSGA
jgi:PAS domain S-box-containing protein